MFSYVSSIQILNLLQIGCFTCLIYMDSGHLVQIIYFQPLVLGMYNVNCIVCQLCLGQV